MATELSREALVVLLIGAATVTIATSSATTLTALLLSNFDNTKFKNKNLKEDNNLLFYFILRLYLTVGLHG